jgi:hypothetical protein
MIMKLKRYLLVLLVPALVGTACKKSILQLANPNAPTPNGSLVTEAGIEAFAQGVFYKWIAFETGDGNLDFFDIAWLMESNMGDEDFSPYSNFGGRYPMNIATITLPAPYNTVINNPSGFATQLNILQAENSRTAGDGNSIQYEWDVFYYVNAQANTLLEALANPALKLSGDAATKKQLLTAWAYYWKGYAYAKLGSMYIAALVDDSPDSTAKGLTSNTYLVHDSIIAASNRNFNQASAIFSAITEDADYDAAFEAMVPTFNLNTKIITPAMWVRQINSFKARNYLVNIKVANMQPADWANVITLANAGMQQGDLTLQWGMAPDGLNDLSSTGGFVFHPLERLSIAGGALSFVSERLIQDIQPGDNRFTKGFQPYPGGAIVNVRSRGIQFGTRYGAVDIENGGLYATETFQGTVPIAPTWEETALMMAEADIYQGQISNGCALIDQVRASQNAGLPPCASHGLTQDSAIAQLHSERRIGLYHHNVSWYDARRWGITQPAADGGGRTGNILVPASILGPPITAATLLPCQINYSFTDYWDVPANETDFNPPGTASAATHN